MSPANQFFLTTEEADRVRKTLKGRLQKCQELLGQARAPSDPNHRQNQVATASFLSDIAVTPEPGLSVQQHRPDAMVAFAVGHSSYPPCTAPLESLQSMKLSDLCIETHHRGHVLTLQRVAPVVKLLSSSWTVVQDAFSSETERLEVFLHKSKHGQDSLELNSTLMVKEPYFTLNDQGETTLRIDHPSDLVVICTHAPALDSVQPCTREFGNSEDVAETARVCKIEGNTALKQKALVRAHTSYTKGLELLTGSDAVAARDLACDLFRNRAHVNLLLSRFDEARSDAVASLSGIEDEKHKNLDSKAYFRAGRAAYTLGEFQKAKSFFEQQHRLTPIDNDATANLRKTDMRLHEQATGRYDFKNIRASLLLPRPRVDAADFTRNVEIGESPGRGRGLFATCNMDQGEIILCEKAFCVVWGHENDAWTAMAYDVRDDTIRGFPTGLCKAVVQKLLDNPSQIEKVTNLYGDCRGIGKDLIMTDDGPVIDTFQVHDIVARNAFGLGPVYSGGRYLDEDVSNASTGLWILASYSNHSCIPTAEKECIGDLLVLRATRPIRAGEEVTHSYDASSDYKMRNTALMRTWGFTCTCTLCVAEKADGSALRKKRRELENLANALMEQDAALGVDNLTILKAKRLARSIEDTYDEERYNHVPRTALLRVQEWLAKATSR